MGGPPEGVGEAVGGPPEGVGEPVGGPPEGVGEEPGAGEAEPPPERVMVIPAPARYSVMLQQGAA